MHRVLEAFRVNLFVMIYYQLKNVTWEDTYMQKKRSEGLIQIIMSLVIKVNRK